MKKKHLMPKFFILPMFIILFLTLSTIVSAAGDPSVTATLKAIPEVYTGTCPAVIKFSGVITVTNLKPGTVVEYRFIRSDGATGPVTKIAFQTDHGSIPVATSWTLGGSSLLHYAGWEAIKVTIPMWDPAKSFLSNKAVFKMDCKLLQKSLPRVPLQR
ncbi:MAG: hypothetical protein JW902_11755 [Syntrophaceae bacterium]|nr:hypothetical protein [Syntrophaceae bacterium]